MKTVTIRIAETDFNRLVAAGHLTESAAAPESKPDKRRGFKKSGNGYRDPLALATALQSDFYVQTMSETLTAYADCAAADGANMEDAYRRRNLAFKSAHPVTVVEAMQIFKKATPDGYNAFKAHCLRHIPDDRMMYLAREGSPCVYVLGPEFEQTNGMLADEFNFYPNGYRKTYGENQFTIPGPCTRMWWD
jgi:hypothetical protein